MNEKKRAEDAEREPSADPIVERAWQALHSVLDPELERDVVSLGLVRQVEVRDGRAEVELALTSATCPARDSIAADARRALLSLEGVHEVEFRFRTLSEEERKRLVEKSEGTARPFNKVRHTLAVMSGKGGVGKSMVTGLLAVALRQSGARVGILDADITGPSIPRMFGMREEVSSCPFGLRPPQTKGGIKVMSMNLLLAEEGQAVIWRGPMISRAIEQFWGDVLWGALDYLLVDLPPGTSDAPLTVLQSLPVESVLLVTSPQELAGMVVRKAAGMAKQLHLPIIGLVENFAHFTCPHCGGKIDPFGPSHSALLSHQVAAPLLGRLPLDPTLAECCDQGMLENCPLDAFMPVAEAICQKLGEPLRRPPRPH